MTSTQINSLADQLVGQFRTFGSFGPAYEVLGISPQNKNGKQTVHIKVLTSGEEVDYPVEQALADPEAR
jgi:hypothetical protein